MATSTPGSRRVSLALAPWRPRRIRAVPRAAGLGELTKGAVDVLPDGQAREQLAEERPLRVKFGVDPTSPDIHLGHCVVLTKLRAFQDAGHTVVLIIGDYTARVGDPSGRDSTRPVLSASDIEANALTYQEQAFTVLDRERTEVRHNSEWLAMDAERALRPVRRFTVARLLERDDFTRRMADEQPISTLELLYPVLQGYDSVAVEADVELGGTDQKFNLLFGRDVQESYGQAPQSILTMPILPGTDGTLQDEQVVRQLHRRHRPAGGDVRQADEHPRRRHGRVLRCCCSARSSTPRATRARRSASSRGGSSTASTARAPGAAAEAQFDQVHVRRELPDEIPVARLEAGDGELVHLPALIAGEFGLSRGEARRLIQQGGVRLDGEVVEPETLDLPAAELGRPRAPGRQAPLPAARVGLSAQPGPGMRRAWTDLLPFRVRAGPGLA